MATIQRQTDQTVLIYDNFYNTNLVVNAADYDVVYSFFKGASSNSQIAGNFTVFLFRIAQEASVNVLELLQTIKGQPNKLQMNKVICYYLNSFKSKTALYGISTVPRPNESVQRNIVL
jgi:hypothetical protein